MKRILSHVTSFMLVIVIFWGFVATAPEKAVTKRPVKFDYNAPTEGYVKSNEISFILLNPKFGGKYAKDYTGQEEPDRTFLESMASDFAEMLTARGYRYDGPIGTYDELVYSQKKNADLILEVEMDWSLQGDYLKESSYYDATTKTSKPAYYYDGMMTLGGRLNMYFSEPFTKQRVWVKAINVTPETFAIKTKKKYTSPNFYREDGEAWNIITTYMEKIYTKTLTTAWNHLDPEELKQKKVEATEIKKNSGFNNK